MSDILTLEQESLMSIIRDEWLKIPFDTSPVNQRKAEAAINSTYESMEESQPREIVWFDNPLDAVVWMINNLENLQLSKHFTSVSHQITWEDELIDFISRDINPIITKKFTDNFNQIIHRKYLHWLSNSFLANSLNCHLRFHLINLWGEKEYLAKRGDYDDIETAEVSGMHDIYYLALSSFYHTIGYDRSEFRGYWEAAKYCGLWWAFENVAIVIPKPYEINLDGEYRLHAEGKPAIIYKGFKSYAYHGEFIN